MSRSTSERFKLGKPRSLGDITAAAARRYPIWLWSLERNEDDGDETRQVPVLNSRNVTEGMSEPIISLEIVGMGLLASGTYDSEARELYSISVWSDGRWVTGPGLRTLLKYPVRLQALPAICGRRKVQFVWHSCENDCAVEDTRNLTAT
jgi:hypothetical protein